MPLLARLVREPLVHFLVIGAALFGLYALIGAAGWNDRDRIVVSEGRIAQFVRVFSQSRGRPPSRAELDRLIEAYVRDEVYYREALKRGLDRDDAIVRRRMRDKMETLAEPPDTALTATDAELKATLEANRAEFRIGPKVAFEQIFLDPGKPAAAERAKAILAKARAASPGADYRAMGDPLPLPFQAPSTPVRVVTRTFGNDFGEAISGLPKGEWNGPVKSAFGLHIVRVTERFEGHDPSLEDVRVAVERKWRADRRAAFRKAEYERLRKTYEVVLPPSMEKGGVEGDG